MPYIFYFIHFSQILVLEITTSEEKKKTKKANINDYGIEKETQHNNHVFSFFCFFVYIKLNMY